MRLRSTTNRFALALGLTGALQACGHTQAVEMRFQAEFNCNDVSVRSIGGSSFIAKGCGAKATYTCTTDRPFGGDSAWGTSSCVRESAAEKWALPEVNTTVPDSARRSSRSFGVVERAFDEKRRLHVVRAKFKPTGLDADVVLVGAPAHELTTVYLHVLVRGNQKPWESCDSLRILVNAEPLAGERTEIEQRVERRMMMRASGRFDFELFKPLARKYAEFGVELCNQRLAFTEEQMPSLLKFLEIFSQLALDAQAKGQATPAEGPTAPAAPGVSDPGVQL
jgi:hypothetical protein